MASKLARNMPTIYVISPAVSFFYFDKIEIKENVRATFIHMYIKSMSVSSHKLKSLAFKLFTVSALSRKFSRFLIKYIAPHVATV